MRNSQVVSPRRANLLLCEILGVINRKLGLELGHAHPRGSLVSQKPDTGRPLAHSWVYARVTDWKKDIALRASGSCLILQPNPGPAASGAAAAAGATPKMSTLEEAAKELGEATVQGLWAHSVTQGARAMRVSPMATTVWWRPTISDADSDGGSFSAENLAQWVPSREEETPTGLECKGMLRLAFEVVLDGTTLKPDATPKTGNPLCLFLRKPVFLKSRQMLAL